MDIMEYLADFLSRVSAVDLAKVKPPEPAKEIVGESLGPLPDKLKKLCLVYLDEADKFNTFIATNRIKKWLIMKTEPAVRRSEDQAFLNDHALVCLQFDIIKDIWELAIRQVFPVAFNADVTLRSNWDVVKCKDNEFKVRMHGVQPGLSAKIAASFIADIIGGNTGCDCKMCNGRCQQQRRG